MKVQVDPNYHSLDFALAAKEPFFVDKTLLLGELFHSVNRLNRYTCVTRPRRFGKSLAAAMIASFFGPQDAAQLFDGLAIAGHPDYHEFLNAYHVIYLDLNPERKYTQADDFLDEIEAALRFELRQCFPDLLVPESISLVQYLNYIHNKAGVQFVFVIDEWDSILHKEWLSAADQGNYLTFFTALLKGQGYVALAYLTGILPISMHSSGSDLNMFDDYTFINDKRFDRFFGFTKAEVDRLFGVYQSACEDPVISRAELDLWYNGYSAPTGLQLYNPQSVVKALGRNELGNYWGKSGPATEVFQFVRLSVGAVREDIETLLVGGSVKAAVDEEFATRARLRTRKEMLSALVVYGLLTAAAQPNNTSERMLRVPNREVLQKFVGNVQEYAEFGRAHDWVLLSQRFKHALAEFAPEKVGEIIQQIHTAISPVKDYNRELELAHVLDWALLDLAVDAYDRQREVEAGNGFADYVLVPAGVGTTLPTYIIELKVGASPKVALEQIKSRNYAARFEQMARLRGRIVAVGISYDPADPSKTHRCEMEVLREAV